MLLDDIKTKLEADGVAAGVTGWVVSLSYQPETPDQVITVYETGGPEPDQTSGTGHDFPSFQVRVRGEEFKYDVARTKMQDVFDSLNDATITGFVYIFAADSGVIPLKYDRQDNRPEMVLNFKTMKSR